MVPAGPILFRLVLLCNPIYTYRQKEVHMHVRTPAQQPRHVVRPDIAQNSADRAFLCDAVNARQEEKSDAVSYL